MLLLEQDTTRKRRVDKNATELNAGNENGDYKVKAIWYSVVLRESQRVIYQGSIIWFLRKII